MSSEIELIHFKMPKKHKIQNIADLTLNVPFVLGGSFNFSFEFPLYI